MMVLAHTARVLAILITLLGVLDPIIVSQRATKADLAVVTAGPADSALARKVIERFHNRYNVVRGPFANAAATITVGNVTPNEVRGLLFAVRDTTRPTIARFDVPTTATTESRLTIPISANGTVDLRANGVILDRTNVIPSDAMDLHLSVTPTSTGPLLLQATVHRGSDSTTALALTNIVDRPHAVLFFDRRPSWMSTFVRRALEQDRRFAVASRVVTSKGVSTDAGQPPSTLADPALLELYDVIVVGAPTTLTAADEAGLETFLRKRGGAVVLLYDEVPTPGIHDRLTGTTRWIPTTLRAATPATPSPATRSPTPELLFTEAAWPAALPASADTRVTARVANADRPLIWTSGLGRGQVIVSGALDSWKFRDKSTSNFDEFWRATISRAAREAPDAITIEATPNVARPGEPLTIRVTLRDTIAKPTATLDSTKLDLWPTHTPGEYTARIRIPTVGDHTLRATADGATADAPIAVRQNASRATPDQWNTLEMLARASGGTAGSIDEVERAIRRSVVGEKRLERWWPMRSGWWIIPFAGLLGLEWLVRRRRGLA